MKFVELRFIAWGPFTNLRLDLSRVDGGLHVVYGENEAGKSSALRGIRALLFGVPERTVDNFLHDGRKLRIATRLWRSDGGQIAFARRKGRKGTLRELDSDAPLPDDALVPFLGGVPEDLFEALFAMDHAGLRTGGEALRHGKGEVGESLFAAAIGGARLRRALGALEREAGALFSPRGQSPEINRVLHEYQEATHEARDRSLSTTKWGAVEEELERAQGERTRIREDIGAQRADFGRLDRLYEVMPKLARLRELRRHLEELGEVVELPETFSRERHDVERDLRDATEASETAAGDIERIRTELERLPEPSSLLSEASRIEEVYKRLGSHEKALTDRPELERRKHQAEEDARVLLFDLRPGLALDDLPALQPTLPQRARIRELAETGPGLVARLDETQRKVRAIEEDLVGVKTEGCALPPPTDVSGLSVALRAAQGEGSIERDIARARSQVGALAEQCKFDLARLDGWQGTLDDIERTPVPGEDLRGRIESSLLGLEKDIEMLSGRLDERRTRVVDLERELTELRLGGEVPTEDELRLARDTRDAIWGFVQRAWKMGEDVTAEVDQIAGDRDLSEAFEGVMRHADELADRLRREAERVAKRATLTAEGEATRRAADQTGRELEERTTQHKELLDRWHAAWEPTGISPRDPREMRDWIDRHRRLLDQARDLRAERARLAELEDRANGHWLAICLSLADLEGGEAASALEKLGLASLIAKAQAVIEMATEVERRRLEFGRSVKDLARRKAAAQEEERVAREALERWKEDWSQEVRRLPVDAGTSRLSALQSLDRLEEIFNKLRDAQSVRHRIEAIDRDAQQFHLDVEELVGALAVAEFQSLPAAQAAAQIHTRLGEARAASARRVELAKQEAERTRCRREAERKAARAKERLMKLCEQAKCTAAEMLPTAEQRSAEARRLRAEIEALQMQILERGGGASIEELDWEASSVDRDGLPARIEILRRKIEDLEKNERALSERIGSLSMELEQLAGGPGAADSAERAQGLLAHIREAAERYLVLRLAYLVLRQQIDRYRTEHQGPILRRAGELFSMLTRGSFRELGVELDEDDSTILVGVRASKQVVRIEGMSDGARDQLYLALRLACVEQAFERSEPLPLILDDVLVNFDDPRAEVALSVLAEFAAKYQILLFTHHDHVRDAAVRVGGSRAVVHELEMSER